MDNEEIAILVVKHISVLEWISLNLRIHEAVNQ